MQTCLIIMGWSLDSRLNIFTQTEQVEFIPVSLCHDQFIECRHYCLSLAWPNDVRIIIVQECRGLSWNMQNILFNGRREGKMCSLLVQQLFIWEPLNILIVVFSSRPPKKRKEIKLFTRKSSQQAKEEREIFLGFLFNYYYYRHGK